MKLTKRENLLLIGGLIIIFLVFYINYILIPQIEKLNAIKTDITKIKEKIAILNSYKDTDKIEKEIQDAKKQLDELDSEFPKTKKVSEFLYNLAKIASENNVRINRINFQDVEVKERFNVLSLKMEVVGNYFDFDKFLKDFEKMKRVFTIGSIDVTKNEDGFIYANLSVNLYMLKGSSDVEPPFIKITPDYKSIDPFITIKSLTSTSLSTDNTDIKNEIERLNNILEGMSQP